MLTHIEQPFDGYFQDFSSQSIEVFSLFQLQTVISNFWSPSVQCAKQNKFNVHYLLVFFVILFIDPLNNIISLKKGYCCY